MKSTKLLAALAGTALLAACTQEDVFKTNNEPQQMDEVVGAKLIGTDISLNATTGEGTTRVDFATGAWHKDDVLGLGWICTDDGPESEQKVNGTFDRDAAHSLYANHMFSWNGESFATKGNIYEGWYFAYYPWGYEPRVKAKVFEVNPAQGAAKENQSALDTRKGQNLFLSNRQFLDENKVDHETGMLNVPFQVNIATSNIVVVTNPLETSSFATNETMKALSLGSVTINVGEGKKVFAENLTLNAANIPVWEETAAEGKTLEETNKAALYNALYAAENPVLAVVDGNGSSAKRTNNVTTDVSGAGYTAGGKDNQLITIVAPVTAELDAKDITLEITAGAGKFVVAYTEAANLTEEQQKNNAALEKLASRYAATYQNADGEDVVGTLTQPNGWVTVPVTLYDDIFVTDFSHICCADCWNAAVDMVDILGRPSETFVLAANENCPDKGTGLIAFNEEIKLPTKGCKITVDRERTAEGLTSTGFAINGTLESWPEDLNTSLIRVVVNGTVNNAHTISAQLLENYGTLNVPTVEEGGTYENTNTLNAVNTTNTTNQTMTGVKNYGTINLAKWAKVLEVNNAGKDGQEGRINVVYGSYVNLTPDTEEGIIAHVVTAEDVADPTRVAKLVADWKTESVDGSKMYAWVGVNTLVVDKGIDIDFTKKTVGDDTEADNDPYTPTDRVDGETTYANFGDMEKVDFEINGGSIYSTKIENNGEAAVITVNNVLVNGGTVGPNIEIAGDLTIESGEDVSINVSEIAGALIANAGKGEITTGNIAEASELNGAYTLTAATISGDLTVNGNHTINAETVNGNITATGANSLKVATVTGDVTSTSENAVSEIVGATIKGNLSLTGDHNLDNVTVEGDLTVVSGTVKAVNLTVGGTLTIDGTEAKVILSSEEVISIGSIVNYAGTLTSNNDITATDVTLMSKSVTTLGADWENTIWYTGTYVHQNSQLNGYVTQYAASLLIEELAAAKNGATVTLKGDVTLTEPLNITKNVVLNLNGKTISNTADLWSGDSGNWSLISVNGGSLTISGGTLQAKEDDCYAIDVRNGGYLTINGGKYVGNITSVYCHDGNVVINDGKFSIQQQNTVNSGGPYSETLNCLDDNYTNGKAKIIVTGGSFYKFNPIVENSDVENKQSYVLTGYMTVENNDWYNVVKE